ncbi:tetratricopeptide repeat protein [Campylobacter concisus]|uniref:tetratricopeptide repeat protein n=1 Tax=Campylobacter concisus TaxID=199 RepID=UPI000D30551C|nr:tetratricopeptide repeat protein [Campylobacter concisus]
MKNLLFALLATLNLFASEPGLSPLLAVDTLEKLKKCKNPDLNATKECVQAGMVAANLKQDYGAAEGLFSLACAKGDGEGCFYLGELYKNNLVKAADKSERETKISAYYKASCVLYEYLPGCLALANFMQEELGDEAQSFAINNTLCNKKYAPGCYNVGWMIERTGGDIGEMMEYYERSCKLGYVGGCERAAWLYEGNFNENRYEQVKKDAKKAKQMRKKACELGDKQSC